LPVSTTSEAGLKSISCIKNILFPSLSGKLNTMSKKVTESLYTIACTQFNPYAEISDSHQNGSAFSIFLSESLFSSKVFPFIKPHYRLIISTFLC